MRLALLVAALGYFVDVFDIWLYSVYRVSSLTALGYSGEALTQHSTLILNAQMLGMILGGLVFGVMGDKLGARRRFLALSLFMQVQQSPMASSTVPRLMRWRAWWRALVLLESWVQV